MPLCNVEELVLVLSNASITPSESQGLQPQLHAAGLGSVPRAVAPRAGVCLPPAGTFSGTAHYTDTR